ncbi:hypothetical protein Scep_030216 [Stephania cephalantha]|uniref:Uncharacterized protein n=1 Tax=Stephania cephalantha TaxID=152367 RepID=A0AAP0HID8_9MAGN
MGRTVKQGNLAVDFGACKSRLSHSATPTSSRFDVLATTLEDSMETFPDLVEKNKDIDNSSSIRRETTKLNSTNGSGPNTTKEVWKRKKKAPYKPGPSTSTTGSQSEKENISPNLASSILGSATHSTLGRIGAALADNQNRCPPTPSSLNRSGNSTKPPDRLKGVSMKSDLKIRSEAANRGKDAKTHATDVSM